MEARLFSHYQSLLDSTENPDEKKLIYEGIRAVHERGEPMVLPSVETLRARGQEWRDAQPSEFRKGLSAGVDTVQGTLYGALGIAADMVGADGVRDKMYAGYQRNMEEAAANAPEITDVQDIDSWSDAGKWFMGTLGQLAPTAAEALVSGLIGGGVAGLAGRKLAKEAIERAVADQIKKGVARDVAEKAVMNQVAKAGSSVGVTLGVGAMEGGGMYGQHADEVGIENANPWSAAAFGLASGMLEPLSPSTRFLQGMAFGREAGKQVAGKGIKAFAGRASREVPMAMAGEAGQEMMQGTLGRANAKWNDPTKDLFDGNDMLNEAAAGAAGALLPGLGSAVARHKGWREKPINPPPEGGDAPDQSVSPGVSVMEDPGTGLGVFQGEAGHMNMNPMPEMNVSPFWGEYNGQRDAEGFQGVSGVNPVPDMRVQPYFGEPQGFEMVGQPYGEMRSPEVTRNMVQQYPVAPLGGLGASLENYSPESHLPVTDALMSGPMQPMNTPQSPLGLPDPSEMNARQGFEMVPPERVRRHGADGFQLVGEPYSPAGAEGMYQPEHFNPVLHQSIGQMGQPHPAYMPVSAKQLQEEPEVGGKRTKAAIGIPEGVQVASSGNPFKKSGIEAAVRRLAKTGLTAEVVDLGGGNYGYRLNTPMVEGSKNRDLPNGNEAAFVMPEDGRGHTGGGPTTDTKRVDPSPVGNADTPTVGKPGRAFLNDNTPVDFRYEIMDVGELVTSHDTNLNINKAYPKELQPRERDRKTSILQIEEIANKLNPERLGENPSVGAGAPIVSDSSNVVESGNGRTIAINKAYDRETGRAYKTWLESNAEKFGLSQEAIRNMDRPVLVRRRTGDVGSLVSFTEKANERDTAMLSPSEQAKIDAGRLTQEDLAIFRPGEDGNLVSSSNKNFVSAFVQKLGTEEQAGFLTSDGRASKKLVDRMQAAIFHKAYGDDNLLALAAEEADVDIRNVLSGLTAAAGGFAKARGMDENLGDVPVVKDIVDGINAIRKARGEFPDIPSEKGRTKASVQLDASLSQLSMFDDGISDSAKDIARIIADNIRSGKRIGEYLDSIGSRLRAYIGDLKQGSLFGDKEALDVNDLINAAKKDLEARYEDRQQDLFSGQAGQDSGTNGGQRNNLQGDSPRGAEGRERPGRGRAQAGGERKGSEVGKQKEAKEENDVTELSSNPDLERDSGNAGTQDAVGKDGLQSGSRKAGGAGRDGIRGTSEAGGEPWSGQGVSGHEAAAPGERGDKSPYSTDGQPASADRTPGSDNDQRGGDVGDGGGQPDRIPAARVVQAAQKGNDLSKKVEAQRKAASIKTERVSLENIEATLPILQKAQQRDVLFAEKRFSQPDGHGVLFTNGTGTGKTFTALGIIKRFERDGKNNVLVVAPDNIIINAWAEAAKLFDIDIHKLADTKDGGSGVTITTYANFRDNNALVGRKWDLIVTDESQEIGMNKAGGPTGSLSMFRALSLHPRGDVARARALNHELYEKLKETQDELRAAKGSDEKVVDEIKSRLSDLSKKWDQAQKDVGREVADAQKNGTRPKVVFLSATPFAYEKNVDYAEGFLFEYEKDVDGGRYNSGDAFDRFMMQHFGYRMRYNKLTEPDKNVNRGLMQRQFNSWLKKTGALSSRSLDVDFDYDRKFVLVESAVGQKIDEGLEFLHDNHRFRPLWDVLQEQFDYLTRRYLLEAIKAKEVIPIIQQHLALGRKVVVFHDYIKGGATNPFDMSRVLGSAKLVNVAPPGSSKAIEVPLGQVAREFMNARPDLANLPIKNLPSPISTLSAAFPGLLVVNGQTVTKAQAQANVDAFNDDSRGPAVLLVQSDKDKGWSGHDTTGKHQRVLINLGLPTRPTRAIQQEGRIYRVGQASNAILRYVNTGTNWERWAFASTIAQRASTAENLAMGEEARALQDSFIQAFEESGSYPPGFDGEGLGGKERDAASVSALTEWDRAITMYFSQQEKTSRTKAEEGSDYFATPEPLGLKMVEWANIRGGEDVLEPSAGHGAIARWFPENTQRTVVEPSAKLASRLKMVTADSKLVQDTFENLNIVNKYDAIIMNPPFGSSGKMAMEHIEKAYRHLRDGGRIVALIPRGPAMEKRIEKFLYGTNDKGKYINSDIHLVAEFDLPSSTFERAGTKVAAKVIVLDKVADTEKSSQIRQSSLRDYSGESSIKDFFERIEGASVPDRIDVSSLQNDAQYSTEKVPASTPLTRKDLEDLPMVREVTGEDGNYTLHFGRGISIPLKSVTLEGNNKFLFTPEGDRLVKRGWYDGKGITITQYGDGHTAAHEIFHFAEDVGLIDSKDKIVLNREAERLAGKAIPLGEKAEARARLVEKLLRQRSAQRDSVLGRIVQKLQDFADALVNIFRRTAVGAVRDFEKGKFSKAEGYIRDKREDVQYSAEKDPATTAGEAITENMEGFASTFLKLKKEIFAPIGSRPDTTWANRMLSLLSHHSRKVPALKACFDAAINKQDNKRALERAMLYENGKPLFGVMNTLKKKDAAAYERLKGYLLHRDMNRIGFRVREEIVELPTENGPTPSPRFVVYSETGKTFPETFKTEDAAWAWAIEKEVVEYGKNFRLRVRHVPPDSGDKGGWRVFDHQNRQYGDTFGTELLARQFADREQAGMKISDAEMEGLKNFRIIGHRMHNQLREGIEEMIRIYEARGERMPEVVEYKDGKKLVVDIRRALAEMGDLRGSYFPRLRREGGISLYATKTGENPRLEFFDTKAFAVANKLKWEKKGYHVVLDKHSRLPEDVYQEYGSLTNLQALTTHALEKGLSRDKDRAKSLDEVGIQSEIRKGRDGSEQLWLYGSFKMQHFDLMASLGGKVRDREKMGANSKSWAPGFRFENLKEGEAQKLLKTITDQVLATERLSLDMDLAMAQAFVQQLADTIRERGSRSRMISRGNEVGKDVALGFEEDPVIAVVRAASGVAGGEAKRHMATAMVKAITGTGVSWDQYQAQVLEGGGTPDYADFRDLVNKSRIDPATQGSAYKEAMTLMKDMTRNEEKADRIIGTLKGLAVFKYLAGNIASPAVNLTNLVAAVPATMNGYGKIPLKDTLRHVGKGMANYGHYRLRKGKGLSAEEIAFFDDIEARGWTDAQMNQEAFQVLQSKLGNAWSEMLRKSMIPFSLSEQMNRAATLHAAYFGMKDVHSKTGKFSGEKQAWDREKALEMAKEISDKAHGIYGKANRPFWARGDNPAAQLAQMAYVFKTFSHNYMLTMYDLGVRTPGGKKAAAWMAFAPVIFGTSASVGASFVIKAVGMVPMLGSDDPEEDFYKIMAEQFGPTAERAARFGVLGMSPSGISLKGSLEIGLADLPTDLNSLIGAPGNVVQDLAFGVRDIWRGDAWKGTERIAPRALASPMKAWREYSEGLTTRSNAPVFFGDDPVKATTLDAMIRALSFTPSRITRIRDIQWSEREREQRAFEERKAIHSKVKRFYLLPEQKRDLAKWEKIVEDISAYNDWAAKHNMTPITHSTIRANLRRSFKASKKEAAREDI